MQSSRLRCVTHVCIAALLNPPLTASLAIFCCSTSRTSWTRTCTVRSAFTGCRRRGASAWTWRRSPPCAGCQGYPPPSLRWTRTLGGTRASGLRTSSAVRRSRNAAELLLAPEQRRSRRAGAACWQRGQTRRCIAGRRSGRDVQRAGCARALSKLPGSAHSLFLCPTSPFPCLFPYPSLLCPAPAVPEMRPVVSKDGPAELAEKAFRM